MHQGGHAKSWCDRPDRTKALHHEHTRPEGKRGFNCETPPIRCAFWFDTRGIVTGPEVGMSMTTTRRRLGEPTLREMVEPLQAELLAVLDRFALPDDGPDKPSPSPKSTRTPRSSARSCARSSNTMTSRMRPAPAVSGYCATSRSTSRRAARRPSIESRVIVEEKTFDRVEVKAGPEGRFVALIATFNKPDKTGEPSGRARSRPASPAGRRAALACRSSTAISTATRKPSSVKSNRPTCARRRSGSKRAGVIYLDEANGAKVFKHCSAAR